MKRYVKGFTENTFATLIQNINSWINKNNAVIYDVSYTVIGSEPFALYSAIITYGGEQ